MEDKYIPLRKCIGCGERKEKKDFLMIVHPPKNSENTNLTVLKGGNKSGGRSAYICANNDCLKKAQKGRRIEKTFRMRVDNNIYSELERMIADNA